MKKLLLAVLAIISLQAATFAQTKPAAKSTTKTVTTTKVAPVKKDTATMKSTTVKLKKDGTPDKRYKTTTTTTGPLKKDGTPDKRYKANKP